MQSGIGAPDASACVNGRHERGRITGTVKFYRRAEGTLVVAHISGLPQSESGFFAFHIHERGNCLGQGFPDTGGHYNPAGTEHPKHAGDLPPLLGCNGKAYLAVLTSRFRIEDIIGRSVVIHSHPDDFHTQPAGGAGEKIACGVIRKR